MFLNSVDVLRFLIIEEGLLQVYFSFRNCRCWVTRIVCRQLFLFLCDSLVVSNVSIWNWLFTAVFVYSDLISFFCMCRLFCFYFFFLIFFFNQILFFLTSVSTRFWATVLEDKGHPKTDAMLKWITPKGTQSRTASRDGSNQISGPQLTDDPLATINIDSVVVDVNRMPHSKSGSSKHHSEPEKVYSVSR